MPVALSRPFGPVLLASGNTKVFTGVAGHVYAVRVFIVNTSSTAGKTIKAWIGGTGAAQQVCPKTVVGANLMISFVALVNGAEDLWINADTASIFTAYAIGIDQT